MSWNIDILIVEPQLSDFRKITIIDVATKERDGLPFWDATSYPAIGEGMAAGNFCGRTILIDPSCRIMKSLPAILKDLPSHKVVFARVANQNFRKTFINGKESKESVFASLLDRIETDGEIQAWRYIKSKTGLSVGSKNPRKDLNKSTYYLYV